MNYYSVVEQTAGYLQATQPKRARIYLQSRWACDMKPPVPFVQNANTKIEAGCWSATPWACLGVPSPLRGVARTLCDIRESWAARLAAVETVEAALAALAAEPTAAHGGDAGDDMSAKAEATGWDRTGPTRYRGSRGSFLLAAGAAAPVDTASVAAELHVRASSSGEGTTRGHDAPAEEEDSLGRAGGSHGRGADIQHRPGGSSRLRGVSRACESRAAALPLGLAVWLRHGCCVDFVFSRVGLEGLEGLRR